MITARLNQMICHLRSALAHTDQVATVQPDPTASAHVEMAAALQYQVLAELVLLRDQVEAARKLAPSPVQPMVADQPMVLSRD